MDSYFNTTFWKKLKDRGMMYYFGAVFVANLEKFRAIPYAHYLRKIYDSLMSSSTSHENLILMD
jgi:hypothetical protein